MANGRCRTHGGTMVAGPGHPAYKHGRSSGWLKSLPAQLQEAAAESIALGAEIAQDNSIAAIDALIEETASQMDRGASDGLWKALGTHAAEARKFKKMVESLGRFEPLASDDKGRATALEAFFNYELALESVFILIEEGDAYAGHRQEMVRLLEQRRKHADTEIKRRTAAFASMNATQVLALTQSLIELALSHISEREGKRSFLRLANDQLPGITGIPSPADAEEEEQ